MQKFTPNENIFNFLFWVSERYKVFQKKNTGAAFPWTEDKIISEHKFTNVFRFLDWESQFLIKHVIGKDNRSYEDTVFRVLLFKLFNLSGTWLYLESHLGEITASTSIKKIDSLLNEYIDTGGKVFSSAYLQASNFVQLPQWEHLKGLPKHHQYLTVFETGLLSKEVIANLRKQKTFEDLNIYFTNFPGIGGFMAYQFSQDLNYTKYFNHDLNSYVKEGPGSIRGVKRCFDGIKDEDIGAAIKWTHKNIYTLMEMESGCTVPEFNGHKLSLPDIQNCFCETDKYIRGLEAEAGIGDGRIKQKYKHSNQRKAGYFAAPVKWNIEPFICH